MMISPEGYYEEILKGKTEKEIQSTIRGLKNEIGHLKNIMEHPNYGNAPLIHPSEDVQICCNRMYLERAKQALLEMGVVYSPSQVEIKAQQFQDNIDYIKQIRFVHGGHFSGYWTYTISIDEEHIHYDVEHTFLEKPSNLPNTADYPMSKADFLEGLRALYIGEWLPKYSSARFGIWVMDGKDWSLEFEYSNGVKTARYSGMNSCPYNFEKFMELCGVNEYLTDALG